MTFHRAGHPTQYGIRKFQLGYNADVSSLPAPHLFNNGAAPARKPGEDYTLTEQRRRYQHDTAIYHRLAAKLMRRMLASEVFGLDRTLMQYARMLRSEPTWAAIGQTPQGIRKAIADHLRQQYESENPPRPINFRNRRL